MHTRYHSPSRRDLEYERDHSLATARMLICCSAIGVVVWAATLALAIYLWTH